MVRITDSNFSALLALTMKEGLKAIGRKRVESVSVFWEIYTQRYHDALMRSKAGKRERTAINVTADLSEVEYFLRLDFFKRQSEYKSKSWLSKSWFYITTKTKTQRTERLKSRDRKQTYARRDQTQVSKSKKGKAKKR